MNNYYRLRKDTVCSDENETWDTYGIDILDTNGCTVQSIPDIFLSKDDAISLIQRCNQLSLSRIHIMDVIEDALAQE